MAHTCAMCGCYDFHYFAIDENGYKIKVSVPRTYGNNHRYRHEYRSWKRSTKAEKQYLRHLKRIEKLIIRKKKPGALAPGCKERHN